MEVTIRRVKENGWGSTKVKSYPGVKTRLGVPINAQGNQVTGLSAEDETRLEEALGYDKGTLRKGDIRGDKVNYWTNYTVDFDEGIKTLNLEIPEEELQYKVLLANKGKVAKNILELKTNPNALFVIVNEEDEAVKENKRGKNKRVAYSLFDEMATADMKNILMLYGRPAESSSPAVIENQLQKLLEDDPALFLANATDPVLKDKVFVLQLVRAGVLQKKGGAFLEYGTEDVLAYDMDSMIKFVQAKANQPKVIHFKEALKNRG